MKVHVATCDFVISKILQDAWKDKKQPAGQKNTDM
jgi:hypothetical protein